jgi:hypothetical protein
MQSVGELEQQIRRFINNPRKQHALLQDTAAWNLLCSCLDTVGDTELAICAYEQSDNPSTVGATYLQVYGLLQALFIQQDAVVNLCKSLAIDYTPNDLLTDIREIRNDSAGHPTKRSGGKAKAYRNNFIERASLKKEGFDLMTTYSDDTQPIYRHVSIESLIKGQRDMMQKVLTEVIGKLKEEEANHRAKYRDQKLQDNFPTTLGYYFQKIAEATEEGKPAEFGTMHVGLVSEAIETFKVRLKERGTLKAYASVVYLIELTEYPLHELAVYFADTTRSHLNAKDAYIFTFFIEKHIEELKGIAKEIDEVYESEP